MNLIQHIAYLKLFKLTTTNDDIASIAYPDAIKFYTGTSAYSHYEKSEDGKASGFRFPDSFDADAREIKCLVETTGYLNPDVKPCIIGERPDINAFFKFNKGVNFEVKQGAAYHLAQDLVFNIFLREEYRPEGDTQYLNLNTGEILTEKGLLEEIFKIEQFSIYYLAKDLYEMHGITLNQNYIENNIRPILVSSYGEELGNKTADLMTIDIEYDKLITAHDFSKCSEKLYDSLKMPIPLEHFDVLYNKVLNAMETVVYAKTAPRAEELAEISEMTLNHDNWKFPTADAHEIEDAERSL